MSQLEIIPLSSRPELAQVCSNWSMKQWGWHGVNSSAENSLKRYQERAKNTDSIPTTIVGLVNDTPAGMVNLVKHDAETRKDLSPWLAGVYVDENYRRLGYASKMIQIAHEEAKKIGIKKLYLATPDMEELYLKNGWATVGEINEADGSYASQKLMEIEL